MSLSAACLSFLNAGARAAGRLALAAGLLLGVSAAAAQETRTAFVHLFEWKWTDVAKECETFLGPKGFAAVQISPPNEHNWVTTGDGAPFPWWMRYQPVSYSLDRSRSGSRAEFTDMVKRCTKAGVMVYADAVINHMSGGSGGISSGGNAWSELRYPVVPYGPGDFHVPCPINDYGDAGNVQYCQLSGLQDLDTGAGYVRDRIVNYLVDLATIGVKGFRVDAAKHMSPGDVGAIIDAVNSRVNPKPYWFLEVIGAPGEAVQPSQYYGLNGNQVNITEFAFGPQLYGKFAGSGRLAELRSFGESWGLMPSNRAVAFTDNHDKQRGHGGGGNYLTYHNGATYDLANVFMLAWPYGYPALMSSFAFNRTTDYDTSHGPPFYQGGATRGPWDGNVTQPACFNQQVGGWVCEHRWRPIANMVAFRNATVGNWFTTDWWDNGGNQIAFGRGSKGFVVINKESGVLARSFQTSLPAGSYCDVISGDYTAATDTCAGTIISVGTNGQASITVQPFSAAAIHALAKMRNVGTASITFNVSANTVPGQNIYIAGNIPALGSWSPANAKALTWTSGSGTLGQWKATLALPAGTTVEYKYIKKDGAGNVIWEGGGNRVFTTPGAGGTQTRNDTWQN